MKNSNDKIVSEPATFRVVDPVQAITKGTNSFETVMWQSNISTDVSPTHKSVPVPIFVIPAHCCAHKKPCWKHTRCVNIVLWKYSVRHVRTSVTERWRKKTRWPGLAGGRMSLEVCANTGNVARTANALKNITWCWCVTLAKRPLRPFKLVKKLHNGKYFATFFSPPFSTNMVFTTSTALGKLFGTINWKSPAPTGASTAVAARSLSRQYF